MINSLFNMSKNNLITALRLCSSNYTKNDLCAAAEQLCYDSALNSLHVMNFSVGNPVKLKDVTLKSYWKSLCVYYYPFDVLPYDLAELDGYKDSVLSMRDSYDSKKIKSNIFCAFFLHNIARLSKQEVVASYRTCAEQYGQFLFWEMTNEGETDIVYRSCVLSLMLAEIRFWVSPILREDYSDEKIIFANSSESVKSLAISAHNDVRALLKMLEANIDNLSSTEISASFDATLSLCVALYKETIASPVQPVREFGDFDSSRRRSSEVKY